MVDISCTGRITLISAKEVNKWAKYQSGEGRTTSAWPGQSGVSLRAVPLPSERRNHAGPRVKIESSQSQSRDYHGSDMITQSFCMDPSLLISFIYSSPSFRSKSQYLDRPARGIHLPDQLRLYCLIKLHNTHLQEVFTVVPLHISREMLATNLDPVVSAEPLFVTAKDNLVLAGSFDTDSVVGK